MADEKQNGAGKDFHVPEGDRYLFVRIGAAKPGEPADFQVLFSDALGGVALLTFADEFLRGAIRKDLGLDAAAPAVVPAGLDIGSLARMQKRMRGQG